MRKLLVMAVTLSVAGAGLGPAMAGLIGMPMNLRAAVEQIGMETPAMAPLLQGQSCTFWTDDVLTGPVLVEGC